MEYKLNDIQRIRNLTTGRLHTEMQHVYEDIEYLVGEKGIMTHMLPNANRALQPYLEKQIQDQRFFNKEYDPDHTGQLDIAPMNDNDKNEFWEIYGKLPSPFGV